VKPLLCRTGAVCGRSLDELFDLWRIENPSEFDDTENLAAIAGAIDDFRRGDRGRPAGELTRKLRYELGFSDE
jgi:hypothetical protein